MSVSKYKHLMIKHMNTMELYDANFRMKPPSYDLVRIFSPDAHLGSAGRNRKELDEVAPNKHGRSDHSKILTKFYNRFPMLKLMPQSFYVRRDFGVNTPVHIKHPA